VLERLLGVETEYAFAGVDAGGGAVDRGMLAARLQQVVRDQLPHVPDAGSAGVYLQNGGRLYVDCGLHPELSTPECGSPAEAVRYVRAGDRILGRLGAALAGGPGVATVVLSRCNVDYSGSGSTWGSHESYLTRIPASQFSRQLLPHLVSRIVYSGAGGFDNRSAGLRFLLSPRVPHLPRPVSNESTHARGIFHTKQEPLCEGYHRLHLLCGESLCSDTAAWLRLGTTALVVALIEAGLEPGTAVELRAPVDAMQAFAGDPTCTAAVASAHGTRLTALGIQRHYLAHAESHADAAFMPAWAGEVCRGWRTTLDLLDGALASVAATLDWAIKLALFRDHARQARVAWESLPHWTHVAERLRGALAASTFTGRATAELVLSERSPVPDAVRGLDPYLREHGLGWDGLRPFIDLRKELLEIDTRFGQLGERGIFATLDRAGVLTHRAPGVVDVETAIVTPPAGGRARLRGEAIRQLARRGTRATADWQGVHDLDGKRTLDLRNPFATAAEWKAWPVR
jgi:hypothetical protein